MSKVEEIKINSNYLRGTLKQSLNNEITGAIADDDQIVIKFHGSYQQDDRDRREERAIKKLEKLYSFMLRLRIAGGKVTAKQWLGIHNTAKENANDVIKITTRQTVQVHGVIKSKLKPTIASFNQYGIDSIAACGDVNRNVMASVAIAKNAAYDEVYEYSKKISDYLLPQTKAYHEIWLDDEKISPEDEKIITLGSATQEQNSSSASQALATQEQNSSSASQALATQEQNSSSASQALATQEQNSSSASQALATQEPTPSKGVEVEEQEPIYGKTYLPRKFKMVIAIPPHNDVDLYAHDIGLIAIIENDELKGFNIVVGGGMGRTHGNENTFARIGDLIGYVVKGRILDAVYHIATIQRDFGNREERSLSRFKYTIDKYGINWFVTEFEKRFGEKLQETKNFELTKRGDEYGWQQDYKGNYHFTVFVESGRVFGNIKEALYEIAKANLANFRFTNNQNIIIADIDESNKAAVLTILEKHKINNNFSPLRLDSIACVALNTCSLALAEAQRYLPSLISKIEILLKKHNLKDQPITIRMTGCPNGCGRPYLAEIGLVGKALGKYDLHLGGDHLGKRLNQIYKESLGEEEILSELDKFFELYAARADIKESFGDFILKTINKGTNVN